MSKCVPKGEKKRDGDSGKGNFGNSITSPLLSATYVDEPNTRIQIEYGVYNVSKYTLKSDGVLNVWSTGNYWYERTPSTVVMSIVASIHTVCNACIEGNRLAVWMPNRTEQMLCKWVVCKKVSHLLSSLCPSVNEIPSRKVYSICTQEEFRRYLVICAYVCICKDKKNQKNHRSCWHHAEHICLKYSHFISNFRKQNLNKSF